VSMSEPHCGPVRKKGFHGAATTDLFLRWNLEVPATGFLTTGRQGA
jgi:hypothetical protein